MTKQAKQRPILFSPEMVQAMLSGRKTQTRRPLAIQPRTEMYGGGFADYKTDLGYPASRGHLWAGFWLSTNRDGSPGYFKCPFGLPGDTLWVKEKYRLLKISPDTYQGGYEAEFWTGAIPKERRPGIEVEYFASAEDTTGPWRPSIHMPLWASRIELEIINIRVERVQSITDQDIREEGFSTREEFIAAWDAVYGTHKHRKSGHDWGSDPWVWVVGFEASWC